MWERLGYASTLSQSVALWYFPVSLAGPLFIDRVRFGGSWTAWIAISVGAQLVLMASFDICRRVIHRPGRPESQPALTLVAILSATFIRGAALGLLVMWFGFSTNIELGYRLVAGLMAATMVIIVALVFSARERHRDLVGRLDRERAALVDLDISMQGRLAEISRGITTLVTLKVEPLLDDLDSALSEVGEGAAIDYSLQSLRRLVDDELRPLSHQLGIERVDLDVLAVPVRLRTGDLAHVRPGDRYPDSDAVFCVKASRGEEFVAGPDGVLVREYDIVLASAAVERQQPFSCPSQKADVPANPITTTASGMSGSSAERTLSSLPPPSCLRVMPQAIQVIGTVSTQVRRNAHMP